MHFTYNIHVILKGIFKSRFILISDTSTYIWKRKWKLSISLNIEFKKLKKKKLSSLSSVKTSFKKNKWVSFKLISNHIYRNNRISVSSRHIKQFVNHFSYILHRVFNVFLWIFGKIQPFKFVQKHSESRNDKVFVVLFHLFT